MLRAMRQTAAIGDLDERQEVDIEDTPPLRQGQIQQRRVIPDTGIIDEVVDSAPGRDHVLQHSVDHRGIGDVPSIPASAAIADLLRHALGGRAVPIEEGHAPSFCTRSRAVTAPMRAPRR